MFYLEIGMGSRKCSSGCSSSPYEMSESWEVRKLLIMIIMWWSIGKAAYWVHFHYGWWHPTNNLNIWGHSMLHPRLLLMHNEFMHPFHDGWGWHHYTHRSRTLALTALEYLCVVGINRKVIYCMNRIMCRMSWAFFSKSRNLIYFGSINLRKIWPNFSPNRKFWIASILVYCSRYWFHLCPEEPPTS